MRNQRTEQQTIRRRIATRGHGDRGGAVGHRRGAGSRIGPLSPRLRHDPCRVDSWSVTWTARAGRDPRPRLADHLAGRLLPGRLAVRHIAVHPHRHLPGVADIGHRERGGPLVGRLDGRRVGDRPTSTVVPRRHHDHDDDHPAAMRGLHAGVVAVPTTTTTTQPPCVDCTPNTNATVPGPTTTTTTVEQAGPTTTVVGQQGPTSSVDQSSGAATTQPVGGTLPANGQQSHEPRRDRPDDDRHRCGRAAADLEIHTLITR